jgi:hypothetical protein
MMRWFMELEPWHGALVVTIAIFAFAALIAWAAGDVALGPPPKGHWMMIGKVPIFFPDNDDDKDD